MLKFENQVSIIIPYYKKKKYFRKTINSLVKQNYKNYELILVYDDPCQKELKFVKKEIKKIKNKHLIINKKNLGAGLSRNLGIKKAKNDFIAFLDSDDYWHKNKLKNQMNFMIKNNADVTFTSYQLKNKNGKIFKKYFAKDYLNFINLLFSCDIGLSTVIIKKKKLNKFFFPDLKTKEDFVLWLKLAKAGCKILGLRQVLTTWQVTPNSLSVNTFQKISDAYKVYNKYLKFNFFLSSFCVLMLSLNYIFKRHLK